MVTNRTFVFKITKEIELRLLRIFISYRSRDIFIVMEEFLYNDQCDIQTTMNNNFFTLDNTHFGFGSVGMEASDINETQQVAYVTYWIQK